MFSVKEMAGHQTTTIVVLGKLEKDPDPGEIVNPGKDLQRVF